MDYLGVGVGNIRGVWRDQGKGLVQGLKKNSCFDALMLDYYEKLYPDRKKIAYASEMSSFFPSITLLSKDGNFLFEDRYKLFYDSKYSQIREKVIYDIKGEFYYLPILYKPHYNIKKALIITNAIFNLLNSIAVYDKVDFDNKMGTAVEIKFNRFSKEIIKDGPVTKIKNGINSINIPFYEFTLKNTLSIFTLRNSNSVKLLTDFFDLQFSRAKISAIKFSNNPNLAKSLHFVLEHDFLKSTVFLKKDNYNVINYLDLNPSTAWNEFSSTYALYPSVLMLRLSLNDLQNLKKLQFDWINN